MVAFYWIVRGNFEAIWLALSQRAYHWLWAIYSALHSMHQHVFTWQHTSIRFYSNGSGGLIIGSNIINVADNNQYPIIHSQSISGKRANKLQCLQPIQITLLSTHTIQRLTASSHVGMWGINDISTQHLKLKKFKWTLTYFQSALCVTHSSRRICINRTKISMPSNEWAA